MKHEAVLLDLGGVVLDIDFRRVFTHWAAQGAVDEARFHERWALDHAYEQHEVGALDFAGYMAHLGNHFEVEMSLDAWRNGWNDLFVGLYNDVMPLLDTVRSRGGLFAFTNTNATHEAKWRELYPELNVFEHIFVSSSIGQRKPHVAAYAYVLEQMGTSPADTLFLDDNADNVEGALAAGLDAKLVRSQAEVVAALKDALDL